MDEREAKRLLVSQLDLHRADGARVDVMTDLSDEEIEHILHVEGDNLADYERFRQRAEHEAHVREQYDGGGGKTSRILRGVTQGVLLGVCWLVIPYEVVRSVRDTFFGALLMLAAFVASGILWWRLTNAIYKWWPCEGDKAHAKYREWQAKGDYSAHTDYTPWWQGLLAWLGGMAILFAIAWAAAWGWKLLEQYAAHH